MKPSHFQAPRQLDDAVFYSAQTRDPVGVDPMAGTFFDRLVTWVGLAGIIVVLVAVALEWI